jgi:N-acetylglucosamine-6-phosphate deacetylase
LIHPFHLELKEESKKICKAVVKHGTSTTTVCAENQDIAKMFEVVAELLQKQGSAVES